MSALGGEDESIDDETIEDEKLSTGIEILDNPEYLDGGFPKGSVITLVANPIATAELFLYDLAEVRHTHYFTTARSADSVEKTIELMGRSSEGFEIVDLYSADDVFDTAMSALEDVENEENVIFDTFSDIVRHDRGNEMLDLTYRVSHETESVTYLYMIKEDEETMTYDESRVPYSSDVVMKMLTGIEGEKVENRLAISKLRGHTPPPKTIKLNIGEEIVVDTSRDIA
jgi:KaiC/GvpD/RAD55 family RecA-like ATPase